MDARSGQGPEWAFYFVCTFLPPTVQQFLTAAYMEPITDYISTTEAIKRFGMSRSMLALLARKGTIKARKVGHDWLIYLPSLKAYLDSNPRPGIKPGSKLWWRTKPQKKAPRKPR
jgi:hypothetical protein